MRRRHWPALALPVALAAAFRFPNLGYSDFQGDEARAMLMAWRLVGAHDAGATLWHKKGPLEIVLPALALALGRVDELTARLPFALAGLASVAILVALAHRLWGVRAALATGVIVALDGYLIAFSRIVQYQSLVLLASSLAVLAALARRESDADEARPVTGRGALLAVTAGGLIGLGSLAHYEAVFALPPIGWLLAAGRPRRAALRDLAQLAVPMILVAGAFYVPFSLHPHFGETLRYIAERRVGGGLLHDNLADYLARASVYNASYFVIAVATAALGAVATMLARAYRRPGRWAAAAWLGLLAARLAAPGLFSLAGVPLSIVLFATPVVALAVARGIPAAWQAMALWAAGPFLVAGFLVTKPQTHFYTMVPGVALLAGWLIGEAHDRLARRSRAVAATGLGAACLLMVVAGYHQAAVLVRHRPEHKRIYPEARLRGYWTPYGDTLPRGGYFGFPYSAGWNVVAGWFTSGELAGSYDSNEEILITGWYTRGAPRCRERPRYYLVAWRPQDAEEIPDPEAAGYHLWGEVRVEGQVKLQVYDREQVDGPVRHVGSSMAADDLVPLPPPAVSQALGLPLPQQKAFASWRAETVLAGADLSLSPRPGGALGITLIWEDVSTPAGTPPAMRFALQSSTGSIDLDTVPGCAFDAHGRQHIVAHAVRLPASLPPGPYGLEARAPTGAGLSPPAVGLGEVDVRP